MALTITEAAAVNRLVRYLNGDEESRAAKKEASEALQLLADHACKSMGAGVRAADAKRWKPGALAAARLKLIDKLADELAAAQAEIERLRAR